MAAKMKNNSITLPHRNASSTALMRDFYRLHTQYIVQGKSHAGIILAPQQQFSIGEQTRRLLKLISVKPAEAMRSQVES